MGPEDTNETNKQDILLIECHVDGLERPCSDVIRQR